ncbi:retroviral-like aspartic protease family protein [Erythrobacter sp.]|uniref:retroviral-like aspartic protease family protein n=1 Tax=Erythrobacter sp. TaxID=1042 RepID=UPI001B240872|nr:retroviral-like aspartic protease family protein [Erythrobacter sp.]MBO6525571.1 aspartyl protease family protein [Erythrobacter sp.]
MIKEVISTAFAILLCTATVASAQEAPGSGDSGLRIPEISPAEFDENLAIGGEEIGARKLRSRMTVDVMVNGTGPHKFVVDSGADTSVVGARLAGELAMPPGTPAMLHGVTESKVVDRVFVDEIMLGPTATTELELPVLDERDLGGDGMIGLDALVEQRLLIDFDERHISVDDGFTPAPLMDGMIIVKGRLQRGQLILTEVTAGKEKVDAVVDTGSEITIGNVALRDKLALRRTSDLRKIKVYGVTGKELELDFLVVRELKLGPVLLRNVPIAFADIPPFEVFGLADQPSLLLGTDLMENFRRVSLDFKDRKVRFQLRKCNRSLIQLRTTTIASRIKADRPSACS